MNGPVAELEVEVVRAGQIVGGMCERTAEKARKAEHEGS
jgi:hypothetical protein